MTNIKRNIKPVLFCVLSSVLSAFCFYEIIITFFSKNTSHQNISKNVILNYIIDTVATFNERLQLGYLIGLGLLALLFELAFSNVK